MKKIHILLCALCLLQFSINAQNITINATGGILSGSYPTLKAAFDAINDGTHQGNIIVQVHKNTTEPSPCLLDSSGNATNSSYTSIIIRPADTTTVQKTISTAVSSITLLTLRGADNVTVDGRPGGTGVNKNLTFSHTSNTTASNTIALQNGASFNSFNYCNISNGTTTIAVAQAINILTGVNSDNNFSHNIITGGFAGLDVNGSHATPNNNLVIRDCQFVNQKSIAIRLTSGVGNMNIDSNRIFHTASSSIRFIAMRVDEVDSLSNVNITRNRIYNLMMTSSNPLYGIAFNPDVNSGSLTVQNNSIVLSSSSIANTATTLTRCIFFSGSANGTLMLEHNTLRIGGTQTTATMQPTSTCIIKTNASPNSVFVSRNNLCINTRTGSANQHIGGWIFTPTAGTNDVDYNTYYGGPLYIVARASTFYNDLSIYKAAAAPLEQNSSFGILDFVDDINPDLQPSGPDNTPALLKGSPSTILTDIYGTIRSATNPYRGAFEGAPLITTPVHLLSFQAKVQTDDVVLLWETASELNSRGYQVERSVDGRVFLPLTFVNSGPQGNSINTYRLTDTAAFTKAASGILYYRLKQIDITGNYTYSPVAIVTKTKRNGISVYPNPLDGDLHVTINSKSQAIAVIDIIDISGKKLVSLNRSITNGENKLLIKEANRLTSGIYFIKINIDETSTVIKLVKAN